jgi:glycosyltransferase 2 family protein
VRRNLIRLIKALVAAVLLAGLYRAANWRDVLVAARDLNAVWLGAAMLMFLPQTFASALRWRALVQPLRRLTVTESVRQTLAASALNLIVPSKLGDLSKAGMLGVAGAPQARAAALALGEKVADVAALAFFWAAGVWGMFPPLSVIVVAGALGCLKMRQTSHHISPTRKRGESANTLDLARDSSLSDNSPSLARRASVLALWSLWLWSLHLLQIGCFLRAAGVQATVSDTLARVPPAIFAGLVPLTLWGVGTRDAVLIYEFTDLAPASTMAVVGMLTALRYVMPGAVGIALVPRAFALRGKQDNLAIRLGPNRHAHGWRFAWRMLSSSTKLEDAKKSCQTCSAAAAPIR